MTKEEFYDKDYYENGLLSKKSLYENYRWLPELTIPLAEEIAKIMSNSQILDERKITNVLDFGCAKGYLVKAFRELGYKAFGIDVSEYAISESPIEIKDYVRCLDLSRNSLPLEWMPINYIIAKDVLEHLEKDQLFKQLTELRTLSKRILVVVPLGDGKKYFIDEYGQDPSHFIKEDLGWWVETLNKYGFEVKGTYEVGNLKSKWKSHHPKGNGLLYC